MRVELPRCQGCGKPSMKVGEICASCLSAALEYLCRRGVAGPVMPWLQEAVGKEAFSEGLRNIARRIHEGVVK